MAGSYLTFGLDQLQQKYAAAQSPYNEFLRRRGMSVGLYNLPVGAEDKQTPHMADEVYFVVAGGGRARGGGGGSGGKAGGLFSGGPGGGPPFSDVTREPQTIGGFAPPDPPHEGGCGGECR